MARCKLRLITQYTEQTSRSGGSPLSWVCYFMRKSRTTPAKLKSSKSMAKGVWPKQKILLVTVWNTLSSANSFPSSLKMHEIENNVFTIRSVDTCWGIKFSICCFSPLRRRCCKLKLKTCVFTFRCLQLVFQRPTTSWWVMRVLFLTFCAARTRVCLQEADSLLLARLVKCYHVSVTVSEPKAHWDKPVIMRSM